MMVSSGEFDRMPIRDYGLRNWDYRSMTYRKPRYESHPDDKSVMTFRECKQRFVPKKRGLVRGEC